MAAPAFVRLAAHPVRWELLTALAGSDLRVRELTAVVPLLALSFFLGIYPKPVIDRVEPSVRRVICSVERGSNYKEPAVAKRGTPLANCAELEPRELAGR